MGVTFANNVITAFFTRDYQVKLVRRILEAFRRLLDPQISLEHLQQPILRVST